MPHSLNQLMLQIHLQANAINCTTNVNALGDVDCLNLNAGQVNASIISSDNISNSNTIF